jgi:UDP-N-acetylglucosamine 1-carboxyvinyltransferase
MTMQRLRIRGGKRLTGVVPISGAKNAALPLIAAALLSDKPLTLSNTPRLLDVDSMRDVVAHHGVKINDSGPRAIELNAESASLAETGHSMVRRMRAAALVLGPLLARFGRARVSLPGGCSIGARPVDLHLKALTTMGASVSIEGGTIVADAPTGLVGARILFPTSSVGATETAMMASTLALGETEIINAAREPEIVDLARCLTEMGAKIEGAGTHRIVVVGRQAWKPARHEILTDRIEAGSYAIAAAITSGELELIGARLEHLSAICQALEAAGAVIQPTDRGLLIERHGPLRAVDITTEPYPGFPTDLQAQWMALMSIADGVSIIRETVFEGRFMHVPELARLGADITLHGTTAAVRGHGGANGRGLHGAPVLATDLRASVCLLLAGLAAAGETFVEHVYHLDRGYEALDRKLARCGADVERLDD